MGVRMRDPKERELFANAFLLRQSREAAERDRRAREALEPRFFARPADRRTAKSKAFARRWLGGDS
jgi:hypothetical protein